FVGVFGVKKGPSGHALQLGRSDGLLRLRLGFRPKSGDPAAPIKSARQGDDHGNTCRQNQLSCSQLRFLFVSSCPQQAEGKTPEQQRNHPKSRHACPTSHRTAAPFTHLSCTLFPAQSRRDG